MLDIPILFLIPMLITFGITVWVFLILDKNGYSPSLGGNVTTFQNLSDLLHLANRAESIKKKIKYYILFISIPVGSILTIGMFFFAITNDFPDDDCNALKSFRNRNWNGIIVDKYRDKQNHNYHTISLNTGKGVYRIQEQILSDFDNFELIEIGDSISKNRGEIIVNIFNKEKNIELKSSYVCDK